MTTTQRNSLLTAGISAAGAVAFQRFDNFWGLVVMGLFTLWALISALPIMDGPWRIKVGFVSAVFFGSMISLWPTFNQLSQGKIPVPAYVRERIKFEIVKGLDLQGGLRLVYTVEVDEAIRDKRDKLADQMRDDLAVALKVKQGEGLLKRDDLTKLEEKLHIYTGQGPDREPLDTGVLMIVFKNADDVKLIDDRFTKKFTELAQVKSNKPGRVTFKIRSGIESETRERAVTQAKETVNRRVDELGLREASVTTRDEDIIIEVPGSNNAQFDEIKEIIRKTARLEFKMLDDEADYFGKIKNEEIPSADSLGGFVIEPRTEVAPLGMKGNDKQQARISFFTIRIPKEFNGKSTKEDETVRKEAMTKSLELLKGWIKSLDAQHRIGDDHAIGYEKTEDNDPEKSTEDGWRTFYLFGRAEVTGEYITDAQRNIDQRSGMPEVYVGITFNPTGADRFEEVTGANVNRRFAIILDDIVNSAPVIKTKIGGGKASITMGAGDPDTQLKNAEKLEMVLRSGALPAPISQSSDSRIGPTLGEDAIKKGALGSIVGGFLVLAFMILYYRKSGIVADAAVLFNLVIQLAILATLSGTLTLPGIAGLALTIGMAVDANVLINERIREELRAGRSVRAAVEAGYDKALSSIVDGHVTVFITGLILMQYGTGPVKGFAVTLVIGILASLFTGVFCTRLVFDWWVRGAKVKRLSVGAEF